MVTSELMGADKDITIVMVDDHELIRFAIKGKLERYPGLRVIGEGSCGDDIEPLLSKHQPDILILDRRMNMSPYGTTRFRAPEAVRKLTKKFPKTRIIILTAYVEHRAIVEDTLASGASAFISKGDTELINFGEVIRSVHYGQPFVSSTVLDTMLDRRELNLLTPRQLEIVLLLREFPSISNREIAEKLTISERTVRNHLTAIYAALDSTTRTECVVRAMERGLIDPI